MRKDRENLLLAYLKMKWKTLLLFFAFLLCFTIVFYLSRVATRPDSLCFPALRVYRVDFLCCGLLQVYEKGPRIKRHGKNNYGTARPVTSARKYNGRTISHPVANPTQYYARADCTS